MRRCATSERTMTPAKTSTGLVQVIPRLAGKHDHRARVVSATLTSCDGASATPCRWRVQKCKLDNKSQLKADLLHPFRVTIAARLGSSDFAMARRSSGGCEVSKFPPSRIAGARGRSPASRRTTCRDHRVTTYARSFASTLMANDPTARRMRLRKLSKELVFRRG